MNVRKCAPIGVAVYYMHDCIYVYNDKMKMAPETLCILNMWRFIGISSPICRTRILMVSRTIAKAFCSVTGGHSKE